MHFHRAAWAALVVLCLPPSAAPASPPWKLAQSEHFQVYSQSSEERSSSLLLWFEQLRAFFVAESGWTAGDSSPVRVIAFASPEEYRPYQLRALADAYYVGQGSRNYIVMATSGAHDFSMAAHEYAHLVLRAGGVRLPRWLSEGLAEFYSTVHVTERSAELGGLPPGRIQSLIRRPWMPLPKLLEATEELPLGQDRGAADLFYAQCWAMTEMLLRSPGYSPRFQELLATLNAGTPGLVALTKVYARSPDEITSDLRAWVERRRPPPLQLPGVDIGEIPVQVSDVPPLASRLLLADVLLTMSELERAEKRYRELVPEAPAEASAALGAIALRRGDSDGARREWKQAILQGVKDASLCYRYALLADQAGLPPDEIRPALERAIALQPVYDDARYQLALLEKNAGRYDRALDQFLAMQHIDGARAYPYWIALADTYNELGRREEAQAAAQRAAGHATTADERARAALESYIAQTDLGVQFTRDASGRAQLVTTRVPHAAEDWNPFVEAGDDLRSEPATLQEIDCSGAVIRLHLLAAGSPLTLQIPDPTRVQMRNAPPDFVCGPQGGKLVRVQYAVSRNADGVLRGMEFR
jgi:tetratricopeptide (TPR) repeat protein